MSPPALGRVTVTLRIEYSAPRSTAHHGNASVDKVHEYVFTLLSTANLDSKSVVNSTVSLLDDKQSATHALYIHNPLSEVGLGEEI